MSYTIKYSKQADKSIEKFKKSNPIAYRKIEQFIKELVKHPRSGTGHPKPLVKGNDVRYSRHITKKDRLVYDVYDDIVVVIILEVESHYDDK